MAYRKSISAREHMVAGAELSEIRHRLMGVCNLVSAAYGAKMWDKFLRVERALDKLRSHLDDIACGEYPISVTAIEGVPITQFYYGWKSGPEGCDPLTLDRAEALRERALHLFDDGSPWGQPPRPTEECASKKRVWPVAYGREWASEEKTPTMHPDIECSYRGIKVSSRYSKLDEIDLMVAALAAIPAHCVEKVASVFCDSKMTSCFDVKLVLGTDAEMAREIGDAFAAAICKLNGGHNGIYIGERCIDPWWSEIDTAMDA